MFSSYQTDPVSTFAYLDAITITSPMVKSKDGKELSVVVDAGLYQHRRGQNSMRS